ncbi:hypothetical protein FOZ62_018479, partial [Perkinsus olseni]
TAHISSSSALEVRDMIVKERPSGVMVELCPKRIQKMKDGGLGDSPGGLGEMLKVLLRGLGSGGGLPMQRLLEQALKGFYGNFKSMGIEPGAEFKNAIEAAEEVGAKVIAGDIDITLTMEGLTRALQQDWQQMLACRELLDLDIDHSKGFMDTAEQLKSRGKAAQINAAMRKCAPHVYEVMIEDRDRTMAGYLCRSNHRKMVGVVGMGHCVGIEKAWLEYFMNV